MDQEVDVAIVGARVAGAVTASLLGALGYHVLLLDRARFPSDTLSTHFFRGSGCGSVLARLGLLEEVLALGCPKLVREYVFSGEDLEPTIEEPQDPGELGFNLSVRRIALDHHLVGCARATPGVEMCEGASARSLLTDGERVVGVVVSQDSVDHRVRARLVVDADGRTSTVARLVAAPERRREPATRALYYRYVRGFRNPGGAWDGPEFSFMGDELAYVFPSDDDIACIALSVNLPTFAETHTNAEAVFELRIGAHRALAERFHAAEPIGRFLGMGPKDHVIRAPAGPGWALVGDASWNQDPWTGLGMDNASIHATYLAEAIDDWLAGRASEDEAMASYETRRDAYALPGFEETVTQGRDLSTVA